VAAASDGSGAANGVRNGVTEAAHVGDERTTLLGFLQRQRDLVAWKVGEASDETLASVRMPSGLTLHGIVRHLENVERAWFRDFFAGQTGLRFDWTDEDPDGDMHMIEETGRHVGHMDLLREQADGAVGEEPPRA
jgi:hypothetical protein